MVDAAIGGGDIADSEGVSSSAVGASAEDGGALMSEEELGVMADLLADMGELPLALRVREHVVERVRARVGSEEGEKMGTALLGVAIVLETQGKLDEAMAMYEEALRITKKNLGPEHAAVGLPLFNVANVLETQGNAAKAASTYEEAARIFTSALGPEHRYTKMACASAERLRVHDYTTEEVLII